MSESSSQTVLSSKSRNGRLSRPICLAARTRSSALAWARCRRPSLAASALRSVRVARKRDRRGRGRTVARRDGGARGARFAGALGPGVQLQAVGDLGHPRALALVAVLANRRPPRRFWEREDRIADGLGQIEAPQEVDARGAQLVGQVVGGGGAVGRGLRRRTAPAQAATTPAARRPPR